MKRRGGGAPEQSSTLFSFFKPAGSSPATSSPANGDQKKKRPKTNQRESSSSSTPHSSTSTPDNKDLTPTRANGSAGSVSMETDEATPTSRKRPHPLDSDDEEIGVRKTLSGRPKRSSALTPSERRRERSRKRRPGRALDSDEEEEEEYCPGNGGEEEGSAESEAETVVTPARKKPRKPATTPRTPLSWKSVVTATNSTPSPSPSSHISSSPSPSPHPATPHIGSYLHDKLDWLSPENIRDKSGKKASDPDYNPRTLRVPQDFLKSQSPAVRQWWKMKSDNYDIIIMFKVGKFYELYHMDAVIGVQELGLAFMRGDFAHSGFPEIAYGRYSQSLVDKGYKVGRVEQTETLPMMEARCKQMATPTKHDRVVRREICNIVTKGTKTPSFSEGVDSKSQSAFLLAIKEKVGETGSESIYGICFVDTSIGTFHLGQFCDDRQTSRLRTLLAHYPPAHLLYERHNLSSRTQQILKRMLGSCLQDALSANAEFWDSHRTLKTLAEGEYLTSEEEFEWPCVLKDMLAEGDSLGLTAREDCGLAISSLGACVHWLMRCLIDMDILSMKSFTRYKPVDVKEEGEKEGEGEKSHFASQRMVLDDITLANLDVLDHQGQQEESLLKRIDHCSTPFGQRLLKQWLCAPLCDPQAISERLDAVETLVGHTHLVGEAREKLKSLPDLERLLRQVHNVGMKRPNSAHPDSRAIMFEEATYSKRKIIGFLSVLEGFKTASQFPSLFASVTTDGGSALLQRVVCLEEGGGGGVFPNLKERLRYFSKAFDHAKGKKEGTIIPSKGVNPAYDTAVETIDRTATSLDEYLKRQRKALGCPGMVYWGTGRNRFQMEVPDSVPASRIPKDFELKSQKKGCRRYWTKDIRQWFEVTMAAEEDKQTALRDTMRTLFNSFSQHFTLWERAVQCLATLDALMSLATYSSLGDGEMCRPEIVPSPVPFLDVRDGRHPCISLTFTGDEFIPNDVVINGGRSQEGSLVVVVTGPNMGGKSTLMRQTGLIVILAQLGCYVPASCCSLSPVDRVFTRIGASDNITSGESTFFIELCETSTILHHATSHSLVLIDELGRGTATYDGTAIASAVLRELTEGVACRSLFSTHYHNLVDRLHGNQLSIALGHMACMVEKEEEEEEGEEEDCREESVTFLYKFMEGACPKSYGFNAAKLAGLPPEVISAARRKAREFERKTEKQRLLRKLVELAPDFSMENLVAIQTRLKQLYHR